MTREGLTDDQFYDALLKYYELTPKLADAGAVSVAYQWPVGFPGPSFQIGSIIAPNMLASQVEQLLDPFLSHLKSIGAHYQTWSKDFPTFVQCWDETKLETPVGIAQLGGRLIPRKQVLEQPKEMVDISRRLVSKGTFLADLTMDARQVGASPIRNSVLPAWGDALISFGVATFWSFEAPLSAMEADQRKITTEYIPEIIDFTAGSGAYLNEGDFRDPNFKANFFGADYEPLLRIKDKYDPFHMFYAVASVGSGRWEEREDHRLCART